MDMDKGATLRSKMDMDKGATLRKRDGSKFLDKREAHK
jgi:hypothetical protein